MEDYNQLNQLLNTTLKDMGAGGELSLLTQVVEMKNDLKKCISEKEKQQRGKIQSIQQKLQQNLDSQSLMAPMSKLTQVNNLVSNIDQLTNEYNKLLSERNVLNDKLNQIKDQNKKQHTEKLTEAQLMEKKVQLYHQITGVFWEDDDSGYVLSEEVAKPIKFVQGADATDQLWEMIDM